MSTRQFAFIVKSTFQPDPYLVEVSYHTRKILKDLDYYGRTVIYVPKELNSIMRSIQKLPCPSFMYIKQCFVSWLKQQPQLSIKSNEEVRHLVVTAIVEYELKKQLGSRRTTRLFSIILNKLKAQVVNLQQRRLQDEQHVKMSFCEDYKRTMCELIYVIKKDRVLSRVLSTRVVK